MSREEQGFTVVQSDRCSRQSIARTPSSQDWGKQSVYSPDGWGGIPDPVFLSNQRLYFVSLR